MTIASLAGIPLDGAGGDIAWREAFGFSPEVAIIVQERQRAEAIYEASQGGPVPLVIGRRRVERVYVTSMGPGNSPNTRSLTLKDERYIWQRTVMRRAMNVRSRTAINRVRGSGDPVNAPLTPDLAYKQFTLRTPGSAWDLQSAIADVLEEMQARIGTTYKLPASIKREVPFEDFVETASADQLLAALFGYAVGLSIVVRDSGVVEVVDELDGSELQTLADTGPVIVGSGWMDRADRSHERPAYVDVYFQCENELRFDYLENQTRTDDDRRLDQVVKVPDRTIQINGEQVGQGSYVPMQAYCEAIEPLRLAPGLGGTLGLPFLARWGLQTQWLQTRLIFDPNSGTQNDKLWSLRLNALLGSFRQDFALPSRYMDRAERVRADRVSRVDTVNKTRAEAEAFLQWTAWPQERMVAQRNRSQSFQSGWFQDDYATVNTDNPRPTRADITIKNPDSGIVRIYPQRDQFLEANRIIAGLPENKQVLAMIADVRSGAASAYGLLQAGIPLAADYKLAVILTLVRGAASTRYLYRVRVPHALAAKVGGFPDGKALGPPASVFVAPSETTTARFAWSNDRADEIDEFVLNGQIAEASVSSTDITGPLNGPLGDLCVNSDAVQALALGSAASFCSRFVDRIEGVTAHPHWASSERPIARGTVQEVETRITESGLIVDRLSAPRILAAVDPLSTMAAPIRARLLGLIGGSP